MPGSQQSAQQQQQQQQQWDQMQQNNQSILMKQMLLNQLALAGQPLQTPFGVLPPSSPPSRTAPRQGPMVIGGVFRSGLAEAGIANLPRQTERRPARPPCHESSPLYPTGPRPGVEPRTGAAAKEPHAGPGRGKLP